jgi:2-polyprenyl-6-hydroxyphenyl methylase/3-demethylubiquinone-9 3-methyltransferase
MTVFAPVVPLKTPCKCCGAAAGIYGVVDFNKNCESAKNRFPLPWSGIPIYYHRCTICGLIFTVALDGFSKDDFAKHIYNDSYELVDPEYLEIRPAKNAAMIQGAFGGSNQIKILDYGSGNGKLADLLRGSGFFNCQKYDPFVVESSTLPSQKFDLILCFEVVEHSTLPMDTFKEMASLLVDDGIILFSTVTQPPNIDQIGLSWWYAGPRNGHVTLFSPQSLQGVGVKLGMKYVAAGPGIHLLFRQIPHFARHLIAAP